MKITEDNLFDVFKQHAQVMVGDGRTFIHFPFWLEVNGNEIITHNFEKLPEPLKKAIEDNRNGVGNVNFSIKKSDVFE